MCKAICSSPILLSAGLLFLACGGAEAEKKEPAGPPPQTVPAVVTEAKLAGAAGPRTPVFEMTGTLPGPGYTAKVEETRHGEDIYLKVMAVPGKGARQGSPQPFKKQHVIQQLPHGKWVVRVEDHRGVTILREELDYE